MKTKVPFKTLQTLTWLEAPGSSDNEEGISKGAGQEDLPASSLSPETGPS